MISADQWKVFQKDPCYLKMMTEVRERDAILMASFREGKKDYGTDDEIRARLSELDFIAGIASAFEEDAKLIQTNKETDNGGTRDSSTEETD